MEMLGLRSMCQARAMLAEGAPSQVFADALAALSIANRQGAGNVRHINVKSLWLQG